MSAPRFVIELALESRRPRVYVAAEHEGDALRLLDWLRGRPELVAVLEHALTVREEAEAA